MKQRYKDWNIPKKHWGNIPKKHWKNIRFSFLKVHEFVTFHHSFCSFSIWRKSTLSWSICERLKAKVDIIKRTIKNNGGKTRSECDQREREMTYVSIALMRSDGQAAEELREAMMETMISSWRESNKEEGEDEEGTSWSKEETEGGDEEIFLRLRGGLGLMKKVIPSDGEG